MDRPSASSREEPAQVPLRRHLKLLRTMGALDGGSSLPIVGDAPRRTLRRRYFPRENERSTAVGSPVTAGGTDLVVHLGAGRRAK